MPGKMLVESASAIFDTLQRGIPWTCLQVPIFPGLSPSLAGLLRQSGSNLA
jgi:hypothetical protein